MESFGSGRKSYRFHDVFKQVNTDYIANRAESVDEFLDSLHKALVIVAMRVNDQSCAGAARSLGVSRTTLVERRKRFGMFLGESKQKGSLKRGQKSD